MRIPESQAPLSGLSCGSGVRLELSQDGREILLRIPITLLAGEISARPVCGAMNFPSFTLREKEVFGHLRSGKVNKEIASAANISVRTVKFHLSNVYRKLHVRDRMEAIRLCG